LIELVEDTTQASAARRVAERELILMASALGKLTKPPTTLLELTETGAISR
jgi:hypothetical protein